MKELCCKCWKCCQRFSRMASYLRCVQITGCRHGWGWPGEILGGEGDKQRFSLEKRSERPWPPWGRGELASQTHRGFREGLRRLTHVEAFWTHGDKGFTLHCGAFSQRQSREQSSGHSSGQVSVGSFLKVGFHTTVLQSCEFRAGAAKSGLPVLLSYSNVAIFELNLRHWSLCAAFVLTQYHFFELDQRKRTLTYAATTSDDLLGPRPCRFEQPKVSRGCLFVALATL